MDAREEAPEPEEETVPEEASESEEATTPVGGFRLIKNPDYKMIYSNGVFGSLTPIEGRMIFYTDRVTPKFIDEKGGMSTDYIEREMQIEVKMSSTQFLSLYKWMENWIKKLEKSDELKIIGEVGADEELGAGEI